jgi:starch synthase
MKVLFVASEAFPLMKTGGLGDVCGALPPALRTLECDVRVLLPGYRDAIAQAGKLKPVARLTLPPLPAPVTLLEGELPGTRVPVWFIDFPPAYDRPGHPYHDQHGNPWPDNAARFALLARVATAIARRQGGLRWQPDIVHCHDWQTGLVPALLAREPQRPATVFTIHNLAYQGVFPAAMLGALGLPSSLWSFEALEFHGQLSFIKGGLAFADWITTVSPTYAREIQTPEQGHGLDGLLRYRSERLLGILNGVDTKIWNPMRDEFLAARYSARSLQAKSRNKRALQKELDLKIDAKPMLIGTVGRLVHQKGIDLTIEALPQLMQQPIQFVTLGTGERALERALRAATARHAGQCAAMVGYDEALAHRIIAGADAFLMPSRFEPCGLSQLYSLRYGTVPIVRRVGGLADTVSDGKTGIAFEADDAQALADSVARAHALYRQRAAWRKLMCAGMRQDFSWRHSAREYLRLYRDARRR